MQWNVRSPMMVCRELAELLEAAVPEMPSAAMKCCQLGKYLQYKKIFFTVRSVSHCQL